MLRFVCDYCGNIKEAGQAWINGTAAENVGTQAARREVIIDPAWRYERAVLPFAVHFCSVECKDNYVAKLFDKRPSLLEVESAATTGRGVRVVSAKKKPAVETARRRAVRSVSSRKR